MTNDTDDRHDEHGRTSIWSVPTQDRLQFSVIFFTMFVVGMAFVSYYEIWMVASDSTSATVLALLRHVGVVGIASLTLALVRFEGGDVMGIGLEWYRKQRYDAGLKAGIEIGRESGMEEGFESGKEAGIEEGRRLEREAQRRRQASHDAEAHDGKDNAPC